MIVRIISGKFGGRIIQSPNSQTTHPMSERIRGSMFNIIGSEIKGAEVLDAFAGTGCIGLESISRGANTVTFIERDRQAFSALRNNIDNLEAGESCQSFQIGLNTWIGKNIDKKFDIIFADPPYNDMQLSTALKLPAMLNINGLMVLSYLGSGEVPAVDGFVVVDSRNYGNAALAFYRREQ